ncbi:MAG: hypothetical protein A2762_03195 [Candidatus Lloydbacteria bacterium RIFCSPHIGHO2_01_FULL_54_11]|nr:MAG: hypothetical protein A2762_03195 [Candidatus Lloydbacteria bacterium RIFCSPHIGHO2_01_FULL_54_11]
MTYSKQMKRHLFATLFLAFAPVFAHAATPANLREFAELVIKILQSVAGILMVSLSLGLLWGVILFFANADNAEKRESIKGYLLWGVIGITVVVGIWGIIALLSATFGWSSIGIPQISPPT